MFKPPKPSVVAEPVYDIDSPILPPLIPISQGVFDVVNALLLERWTGSEAILAFGEVKARIMKNLSVNCSFVHRNKWFDFEEHYVNAGWDVTWRQPDPMRNGTWLFKPKSV